jgi:hypothetical protein
MIVDNLDIEGFAVPPDKTYPPLIIDADAVLAVAVPRQSLQPVATQPAQIVKTLRCVDHKQLRPSPLLYLRRQPANRIAREDRSSALVAKTLDHAPS